MAAAHVTGIAAALWEQDKSVSADFIRRLINTSAKTYDDSEMYGHGLADMEKAFENYDTAKAFFAESTDTPEMEEIPGIDENTEAVETYDEIDYVEGLWSGDDHKSLAGIGNIEKDKLGVLKLGAVANDKYIQGMTAHPQWHGFFESSGGTKVNYVACYIFLTGLAINAGNAENGYFSPASARISGMSSSDYDAMKNVVNSSGVNGTYWSSALGAYSVDDNKRKLFIYGMALHVATDTFAHSTYDPANQRITHTSISYNGQTIKYAADSPLIYPNRFTCAKEIARNVLRHYSNSEPGDVSDFYLEGYLGNFHLRNIRKFVKELDYDYYLDNQSYFDDMNYPIQDE